MRIGMFLGFTQIGMSALLALLSIPLIRNRVGMNSPYGVRIAKSFQSEELWYRINEYGGKMLAVGLFISLFFPIRKIFVFAKSL